MARSSCGVVVGVHRIRRKLGLRCLQKRKFNATTDSRHSLPVAENLLDQKFEASAPNQIWLTDITYIPTLEGWLYLAGHKDVFAGEIVGYAMAERMTKYLVSQSLLRALATKRPAAGLIYHSDRGSQYCAREYASLLDRPGMVHESERKLLRQRLCGKLLGYTQERADPLLPACHKIRSYSGYYGVHRDFL